METFSRTARFRRHNVWRAGRFRFTLFSPDAGIDEDPVTGSSHASPIPFRKNRLDKTDMTARQLSSHVGFRYCRDRGERVEIGGPAIRYRKGETGL